MSILLNIPKPTRCEKCPCYDWNYQECQVLKKKLKPLTFKTPQIHEDCPIVEVSDDTLIQQLEYLSNVQLKLKELVKYVSDNNLIISEVDKG